jgi:tartrate dehydratase beta subunit/fumarate hydratase class I family protein
MKKFKVGDIVYHRGKIVTIKNVIIIKPEQRIFQPEKVVYHLSDNYVVKKTDIKIVRNHQRNE